MISRNGVIKKENTIRWPPANETTLIQLKNLFLTPIFIELIILAFYTLKLKVRFTDFIRTLYEFGKFRHILVRSRRNIRYIY